jgi:outer membrane receptor protein involved in Fe transport
MLVPLLFAAALTEPAAPPVTAPAAITAPAGVTTPADEFAGVGDFGDLGIDDLLSQEVSVASKSARTLRDAPGIVSVVTRQEIRRSGARELIDILRFVEGVQPGVDVEGVVGLGVRGIWGHEGKVLLLIDGVEMNEPAFSSIPLGFHYPVDTIERIEIIRGPGSVLYGGFAELAVINVITTGPKDLEGARISASAGRFAHAPGHAAGTATVAGSFDGGRGGASASAFAGKANRTDGEVTDVYGGAVQGPGNQTLRPLQTNLGLRWRDFSLRYIYDNYDTDIRDGFDTVLGKRVGLDFEMHGLAAEYAADLGHTIVLRPAFRFNWHRPWRVTPGDVDLAVPDLLYTGILSTYKGALLADARPHERIGVLVGAEYVDQRRHDHGVSTVRLRSAAALGEVTADLKPATVFAGARFERHFTFGNALVPRVGATALVGPVHGKLLVSQAYRTPGAENAAYAVGKLTAERTTVYELEAGWQAARGLFLVGNFFQQQIRKPIIYFYDAEIDAEGYRNQRELGTRGVEFEVRAKGELGYATLGYSLYRPYGRIEPDFAVPGRANSLLAFANHKLTALTSLEITRNLSFNPSAVWLSKRWAITAADDAGAAVYGELPPQTLLNAVVRVSDLPVAALDVNFGVMNVLGEAARFVQPYAGYHAPLAERGREFVVQVEYELGR